MPDPTPTVSPTSASVSTPVAGPIVDKIAEQASQQPETPKQARPSGQPDGAMVHVSLAKRTDFQGQSIELDGIARKAMGLDQGPRKPLWSSTQGDTWKFFRSKPAEELFFPEGHELVRQPRYRWFQESPKVLLGYLKPEAIQETKDRENLGTAQPALPVSIEF